MCYLNREVRLLKPCELKKLSGKIKDDESKRF